MKNISNPILLSLFLFCCTTSRSQTRPDSVLHDATLAGCVQYAITHQPVIQQALLDEAITEKQIQARLADWYPQVNLNYNLQHSFELPVSYFSGGYVRNGTFNSSNIGLNVTQNIFNKDVLFASRTANDIRQQTKQNTSFNKIDIAVNVSKAFYDVLLTQQQVSVLGEAITRLEKSLKDAVSQYQSGVADKTDYKRATIALNNAKAQRKQSADLIVAKIAYLKQLMGLSDGADLKLQYDTSLMERDAIVDTSIGVQYDNRIEYKILQTQQRLQEANIKYYKSSFVPTISAFGNYNMSYLNNDFGKTYSNGFGNSNLGITLAMPIFQGNKRVIQIRQAELQYKRVDWDIVLLKSRVNAQYVQAIAVYKGNLSNYYSLKENVVLADDVYKTLDLQYRSGIKTYLDVIIAESDLRTTQLNYYNALFQVLQCKIDVQKALGNIQY
ncbi:MAG: TolC family protein [Sediminibacterium sp.]|nr:TolC family protein [Sediminibacterium sp.]